ncbi:polyphosphate kinase 1 [Candidatus Halobonum tyrrellensis]|uniref:Polyphosphate kinase n=1 Tax=Candidatus Halobonum tyrrellensis G22 TaxID=1324957 RepID=V4HCQ5_9EURY|nr:polyphosphate kinase 1 [Candidatus Halobonum tyrrellensis]ESP87813.1 polyphosphate kinase [Candidatus Halobonum tyrrellensis G22]
MSGEDPDPTAEQSTDGESDATDPPHAAAGGGANVDADRRERPTDEDEAAADDTGTATGGEPAGTNGGSEANGTDEADDEGGPAAEFPAAETLVADADPLARPWPYAGDDRPAVEWGRFGARTPPTAAEPLSEPVESPDLDDARYYLSRELSELSFQRRVLHEAEDDRVPLLTRLRFLDIVTTNMDEFFRKRVGGLKQQLDAGVTERTVDGRTPGEQLTDVLGEARDILDRQSRCYRELVEPALSAAGVDLVEWTDLDDGERAALREHFERSVLPTLTPLTFDPAHPFPFISNLSLSVAVLTRDEAGERRFSRIKVPQNRPRLIRVDGVRDGGGESDGGADADVTAGASDGDGAGADGADATARFLPIERLIEANLDLLFPDVAVLDSSTFRVTRNAEVRRNEDVAEGLIEMIEDVLRQRRFATVVRLEVADDTPEAVRKLLVDNLDVTERETFDRPEPLALDGFDAVLDLDRPDLRSEPWSPQNHPRFAGLDADRPGDLFDEVKRGDVLVHHPYHSFANTVQTFLDAAARDPDTLAIKVAIYRTAPDSKVVQSLIAAAKNGKQVAVMVELKARFDEENNLRWVKRLEEEGIHVAYGTIGLKTHSKVALVVREEGDADEVRTYAHVGTGNYHSETAKSYEDLGLFTADPTVGGDVVKLFNSFTSHARQRRYDKLLVAPENLREGVTEHVRREADVAREGGDGRIVAKMNALEDPAIVRELYEAARAGVDIDLVVRGICRLRPGVEGLSETVRVHSVVGTFLEHSRVYYFGNGAGAEVWPGADDGSDGGDGGDPAYYVGSADWMTRNLDRRVEAVAPVEEPTARAELRAVLETMLADNRRRWRMGADGSYAQVEPAEGAPTVDVHERLMERARRAAPDESRSPGVDAGRGTRDPAVDLDDVYTDEGE